MQVEAGVPVDRVTAMAVQPALRACATQGMSCSVWPATGSMNLARPRPKIEVKARPSTLVNLDESRGLPEPNGRYRRSTPLRSLGPMSDQDRQASPPDTGSVGRGARVVEILLTVLVLCALAYQLIDIHVQHHSTGNDFRAFTPLPQLLVAAAAAATVTRRRHPVWMIAAGAAW